MFEELPVTGVSDFIDRLKLAFQNGDWEGLDEEADFTIEVSAGQKKLFTARAEVILYFGGYNETTYHSSATYWSPEEWGGTATVSYNGIDDYLGLYVNKDQEISIESFAEQIPEGKFRDLYIKYAKQIIKDTIDKFVTKACPDYEYDWD